jgi:predicted nucleotide-binding protein (sugar kinase/HSP70/actin superfamily)
MHRVFGGLASVYWTHGAERMRPLVERLRQVVERGDDIGSRNLAMMAEAADELESYSSKLEEQSLAFNDGYEKAKLEYQEHLHAAEDENKALTSRLDSVIKVLETRAFHHDPDVEEVWEQLWLLATGRKKPVVHYDPIEDKSTLVESQKPEIAPCGMPYSSGPGRE